jgi:hypothetical protein
LHLALPRAVRSDAATFFGNAAKAQTGAGAAPKSAMPTKAPTPAKAAAQLGSAVKRERRYTHSPARAAPLVGTRKRASERSSAHVRGCGLWRDSSRLIGLIG